jgi:hypothetical protein
MTAIAVLLARDCEDARIFISRNAGLGELSPADGYYIQHALLYGLHGRCS